MALPSEPENSVEKSSSLPNVNVIDKEAATEDSPMLPFVIVGVGASAGGLEAFSTLLQHLPADTGMAFVLVQHLSPLHKSMLSELLAKQSHMPVHEVSDGLALVPNCVYVIPPNTCMHMSHGVLRLHKRPQSAKKNLPIDFFLSSLARHQKHKAVAVILSGTASDGCVGIKDIKDYGGITFAQDESSAQFTMMPHNAIDTGCIDFVLSPENIAKELLKYSRHAFTNSEVDAIPKLAGPDADFAEILQLLQKACGVDFNNYKSATLKRRILRRMMLRKIETFKGYIAYLIENPQELQALTQDVFITVTRFFRDAEVFETLKHDVFPPMVANRGQDPIRMWVLGCSTGEEVYSLAISVAEFMEGKPRFRIQIFATDIKESSIEIARQGIYAESVVNDISELRLRNFFTKVDGGYQVNKYIRDMCVFARQNVTADPPFSKLDFISCRNLLIYLDIASQKRIIPIFHYALKPGGFLLVGMAESISACPDLFEIVNKKSKVYSKNYTQKTPQLTLSGFRPQPMALSNLVLSTGSVGAIDIQREADRVVLKKHNHGGVVVKENMDIIQFRGDTSRYFTHASGAASLNIFKMLHEGLVMELRNALQTAAEKNIPVTAKSKRIDHEGNYIDVLMEVSPFKVQLKGESYFLIIFDEQQRTDILRRKSDSGQPSSTVKTHSSTDSSSRIDELERELEMVRLHLQGTIDAKGAANQELQSANEEILSTNEELQSLNEEFQSTNEELESAKEELQATNEEITTINDELQKRIAELSELNDVNVNLINKANKYGAYREAIIQTVRHPILVLDSDLKVKMANQSFYATFKAKPEETLGCSILEMGAGQWNMPELRRLLEDVLPQKSSFAGYKLEHDFQNIGRKSMLLNARQVMYGDEEKGTILLAIEDITVRKQAEQELCKAVERLKHYADELLRSNKDLEEFAAIASHDLQEPLNLISNYMHLLSVKYGDDLDATGQQYMGFIVERIEKMQGLIRGLLAYSKVSRDKNFKETNLEDVCRHAIKTQAINIKKSRAKITYGSLPTILIDETLITQLFENLISNAVKFRNLVSAPRVHFSAVLRSNDWVIAVRDNGIGIAFEHQERIFEIFKRVEDHNIYPGTGIGLALCKRVIEFHDGKIWMESEVGKGSTFYFSLPASRDLP